MKKMEETKLEQSCWPGAKLYQISAIGFRVASHFSG